jgi:hypothetical protein
MYKNNAKLFANGGYQLYSPHRTSLATLMLELDEVSLLADPLLHIQWFVIGSCYFLRVI